MTRSPTWNMVIHIDLSEYLLVAYLGLLRRFLVTKTRPFKENSGASPVIDSENGR